MEMAGASRRRLARATQLPGVEYARSHPRRTAWKARLRFARPGLRRAIAPRNKPARPLKPLFSHLLSPVSYLLGTPPAPRAGRPTGRRPETQPGPVLPPA